MEDTLELRSGVYVTIMEGTEIEIPLSFVTGKREDVDKYAIVYLTEPATIQLRDTVTTELSVEAKRAKQSVGRTK